MKFFWQTPIQLAHSLSKAAPNPEDYSRPNLLTNSMQEQGYLELVVPELLSSLAGGGATMFSRLPLMHTAGTHGVLYQDRHRRCLFNK